MTLRRKLLLAFSAIAFLCVLAVTWIVLSTTRRAFERLNEQQTEALIAQFQREFKRRGDEVLNKVTNVTRNDSTARMAAAASSPSRDYAQFLSDAKDVADNQQLDCLEFADADGTIISSAQFPAMFGYKDNSVPVAGPDSNPAFLRREALPDRTALSLSAVRRVETGNNVLYVIGGRLIDNNFIASLEVPAGVRAMLYQNLSPEFSRGLLIDSSGQLARGEALESAVRRVQVDRREITERIHWSSDAADDEDMHAIPLNGQKGDLLAVLLIGNSRRPYVEFSQRIRLAAMIVAGSGILLAILFSSWVAARVTQPVEQLAVAAREVAEGNLNTQVEVKSADEIGELAETFNRMTREILEKRELLVQTERVAAWRDVARRLAHELKNPLFPLQLTVENLVRAREQSPDDFEEVFRESSATLLSEIANLKAIVSRFSEFSRMPKPQYQNVDINNLVENVMRLFQAQLSANSIECHLDLMQNAQTIAADPDMLHRAISNLVLNAIDAITAGGRLAVSTRQDRERTLIRISDSGAGLTAQECSQLFTPYYTTKKHGTGLGLAIVQSVISDHGGKVTVQSEPGQGATFIIDMPNGFQKLPLGNTSSFSH